MYLVDTDHNRIPDYRWAGYRCSQDQIPNVETVTPIEPVEGDNTDHIEEAVREVGNLVREEDREHAVLELALDGDRVDGPLSIPGDGVVLRGAGDGTVPAEDTILVVSGAETDDPSDYGLAVPKAVEVGASSPHEMPAEFGGPEVDRTTDLVRVGERSFEVENAEPFEVGDHVGIYHPCTSEWLDAIDGGGTGDDSEPDDWAIRGAAMAVHTGAIEFAAHRLPSGDWPEFDVLAVGVG